MQYIQFEINRDIAWLTLNRPQQHNAFNAQMIAEIREAVTMAHRGIRPCRALVINAQGKSFCAGADLNYMRDTAQQSEQQNYEDALNLAAMLSELYHCPLPTIAAIHGNAFGGGVGLAACCDSVIATRDTRFCLSEVKLGLIPATISPYVVKAIGERHSKHLFITAQRFNADQAFNMGLVHQIVDDGEPLISALNTQLALMASNGPNAMQLSKQLAMQVADASITAEQSERLAKLIAQVRASDEGQEGLNAFLQKRRPNFTGASND